MAERCTGCHACVEQCPTRVFEPGADGGLPVIAAPDAYRLLGPLLGEGVEIADRHYQRLIAAR